MGVSPIPIPYPRRARREIAERLERAAADATVTLAAEVDRVSKELKSEHEKELQAAMARERESMKTRHALVLQQTQDASKERELREVRLSTRAGPTLITRPASHV